MAAPARLPGRLLALHDACYAHEGAADDRFEKHGGDGGDVIDARDLMRLHVEALFTLDGDGHLVEVNDAGGRSAPRFFLGRYPGGVRCWFRRDLDAALVGELEALARSLDPDMPQDGDADTAAHFAEILAQDAVVERVWSGPAFCFPERVRAPAETVIVSPDNADVLKAYFDDWLGDVEDGLPFTAVLEGGSAVSLCCSVRVTADAHEAGVDTHPEFRGRGLAGKAVAAWGRLVRKTGRVPLYSTSWRNAASRSVAGKLGLIQFGADLHIT